MSAHPTTGYPLMAEGERVLATLAGENASCSTCQWAQGGAYGPVRDSWRPARCERRYLELMDLEYVRWPDGAAPYRDAHRPDAACGAGTASRWEWIRRLHTNVEYREPADDQRHRDWWRRQYPHLGEGNRRADEPACIHWLSRGDRELTVHELWAELDAERAA